MRSKVKILKGPKSEAQHQANVIKWSLLHREERPELALLHHIPNGGRRDPVEARHLKELGVKPGVPDLFLPVARGGYHGLYIEMKSETGHTSREQEDWGERLTVQGYRWQVCHGWEAAAAALEWYLSLPAEAAP